MTKAAILIGAILLLAGVATAGTVTGLGSGGDSPTVSIPDDSLSIEDETISTGTVEDQTISTETGEDISGPCDEPEHAADPRCTGAAGTTTERDGDDRRRRGRGRGDDRDEDRSGPNRGPGRDDDQRGDDSGRGGNSGRGGGHDD
jgi:hypothetical protein